MSNGPAPVGEGFLPQPSDTLGVMRDYGWRRTLAGSAMALAAGGAAFGIIHYESEPTDAKIAVEMSHVQVAQDAVSNADKAIEAIGEGGLILTLGAIGGLKIASRRNSVARAVDFASSKEMSGVSAAASPVKRALKRIPAIAVAGVALGTFTGGIGAEVSEGPNRPIEVLDELAPGKSMVVQYEGAMPMVQSTVNNKLTTAIKTEATKQHIAARPVNLNLGTLTLADKSSFSDLTIGLDAPAGSPLDWKTNTDCLNIPVMLDESAHVATGAQVDLNGIAAHVVGKVTGSSAINRIGVAIDREALTACLDQNPGEGAHAVILDTDPQTANKVLAEARNGMNVPATVITKDQYKANSQEFWTSNVKPITNVLEGASTAMALVSIAGALSARMLRNRRELAIGMARQISDNKLRAIELARAAKDGLIATGIGVPIAVVASPIANMLITGFKAGVGFNEIMLGAGVGLLGTIGGAASKLIRPRKTIKPEEAIR